MLSLVVALVLILHVVTAIVGTAILSTIPRRLYNEKLIIIGLCWLIPFFGVLLVFNDGEFVPTLGRDTYQLAREAAAAEYREELAEIERARAANHNDSRYGESSTGFDGDDD